MQRIWLQKNTVPCIMGPTAIGKSDLAIKLCQYFDCEIINVDSALIYKKMDIGTAKPDKKLCDQIPHHLMDICDAIESYSAAQFCADVTALIADIFTRNKTPLLVGGTMMYFKALQQGLAVLPKADAQIRAKLTKQAQQQGLQSLHQQLKEVDPISAQRIHPNDPQRLQRALEVYLLTGKTMTELFASQQADMPFQYINIGLVPHSRQALHQRIALRYDAMLAQGFVEEVRQLYERGDLHLDLPSMRCVGYRQVWQYLAGEYDYDTMREKAIIATRQLAKRQLTWLRSWPDIHLVEVDEVPDIDQVLEILNRYRD